MRRALWICLLLAGLAAGEDVLVQLQWTVQENGDVFVWPHPRNGTEDHEQGKRRPMFGATGENGDGPSFMEGMLQGGYSSLIALFFSGPLDLASRCDKELHFRRLQLGWTDEEILRRLRTPPAATTEPLRRRAALDRLLAVRVAHERKLAKAEPFLRSLLADPDPFVRRAAAEALAAEWAPPRLPPLQQRFTGLPAAADLVVVIDHARLPLWKGMHAAARAHGLKQARKTIDAMGAAVTPSDLAGGQLSLEGAAEWFYEAARRFGNVRQDRTVLAVRIAREERDLAVHLDVEGRFDVVRAAVELRALRMPLDVRAGALSLEVAAKDLRLQATDTRLRVVKGEFPRVEGRKPLQAPAPGDSVWVHLRAGTKLPRELGVIPGLGGLEAATFRVSLQHGLFAELQADYADTGAARTCAGLFMGFKSWQPSPQIGKVMEALRVGVKDKRVTITLELEDFTAARLLDILASLD